MYRDLRITVCLPCRNEAKSLKHVLSQVPKFVDEVIVISNRSTDDTVKVASKLGVVALKDDRAIDGIGYGFAHMTGIQNATGDIIVGADGDATYPLEDLPAIIDYMLGENLDFVSCNRYPLRDGTKIPFMLKFGVWLLNTEVQVLHWHKIQDILSGMWVFKKDIRDELNLTAGDWNLSPQIKINAAVNNAINFGEYNIVQHKRMGESHQNYFQTGFRHAMWILKDRFMPQRQAVVAEDDEV